jgi:signal transduction histidine kinase
MRDIFSPRHVHRMPWAALLGAVALLIAGVVAAFYEEQLYQTQRAEAARGDAQTLAASVAAALAFTDRGAAEEYVRPMQANPAISAVGIYAKDGRLLTGFARAGSRQLAERLSQPLAAKGPGVFVAPVSQHGTALGWVYLRLSPEPRASRLSRYAVVVMLALMAIFVVVGLGSAQGRLARQSESLSEANARLQDEIAERQRVEEALRQSQKMEALGQLSGGMAHDLNNHLMIIRGNLHLLKKKLSLPDGDRHVSGADEGIRRAAALTQRVLVFSRKQPLSPVKTDLNDLVAGMHDLIRSSLHENISLDLRLDARFKVLVDRNQMENIVLNIVVNARDALPEGGKVVIATRDAAPGENGADGRFVALEIADTGIGMTPDVQAKAFDPFFTTKPFGQGTGLGLSTAYGFVTQSGGHMRIKSAPGDGTAISIYLPAAADGISAVGDGNGQDIGC